MSESAVAQTEITNYDVAWGDSSPFSFGGYDKVTLNVPAKLKPIFLGNIGDLKLDDRIIGLEDNAMVEVAVRTTSLAMFQAMHPWWSSGAIAGIPSTANARMQQYAELLRLHPQSMGAAATRDLCFIKAVPLIGDNSRDGRTDGTTMVRFMVYPDLSQLPLRVYHYIGNPPE